MSVFCISGNLGTSYLFLPFIEVLSYPAYGFANRCVNPSNAPSTLLRASRTGLRLIQDGKFRLSKVNLFVKKFFLFCFFPETPSAVKYGQSETDVILLISILHVIEFDIIFPAPFDCDFFYGIIAVGMPFVFDTEFIYRVFESSKGAAAAY